MWEEVLTFAAVGFAAQLVDGAIGMAYGVTSSSVLLSLGVPPATTSACVHAAETFTTAASGVSHWRFGNIDFRLLRRLAIPGMIGGAAGAYLLTNLDGALIKPYISAYLLVIGVYILIRALRGVKERTDEPKHVAPLGLFGGFVDSIGGGGWGPIVTTSLIGQGTTPRIVIGTVSLAEFFVTATISATFLFTIGLDLFPIILGLVIGGVLAAPLAAFVARHLPAKVIMLMVGTVIVGLSLRTIIMSL